MAKRRTRKAPVQAKTEAANKTLLMTEENPNGWKLEDLLDKVHNELNAKSQKILSSGHKEAKKVADNNKKVIQLLDYAKAIQEDTVERLAKDTTDPLEEKDTALKTTSYPKTSTL